jgi:hypothetical protein
VRNRLIVFGGETETGAMLGDVWALSLSGTPMWAQLTPTGTGPSARVGMGAVYDPVGDRVILFAGHDTADRNDVFQLSLAPTPAWSAIVPAGSPPPARALHVAIYDPHRLRAVFYGGLVGLGAQQLTDTWALSLAAPSWSAQTTTGSPPTASYGFYDGNMDRLVIFEGESNTDVWALSFGSLRWQALPATGTFPPRGGCMVLPDPITDGLLVFGGLGSPYRSDTWRFPLAGGAWTQVEEGEPLLPGLSPVPWVVRDSRRERMLVLLGTRVWSLSLDEFVWGPLSIANSPPAGWSGYSAVYDRIGDRVLFFGGTTSSGLSAQTWALTLSGSPQWTLLSPSGTPPSARQNHAAVVDTLGDRMLVFGGTGASGALNDVWSLSLSGALAWSALSPTGTAPPPQDARGLYDEGGNRMLVLSRTSFAVRVLGLGPTPSWSPATSTASSLGYYDAARQRGVSAEQGIGHAFYGAIDLNTLQYASLSPTGVLIEAPIATMLDPHRHRMVMFGDSHCSGTGSCTNTNATFLWTFPPTVVAVDEPAIEPAMSTLTSIEPSPARGPQRIAFHIGQGDPARAIEIYSVDGRRVWSAPLGAGSSGAITWDGRTAARSIAPAAVYFARLVTAKGTTTRRFVRL